MTPRRAPACTCADVVHVHVAIGRSLSLARLTDSERWCFVAGVLPIAAKSDPRGRLVVDGRPVCDQDVAAQAGTRRPASAGSALAKLREAGVIVTGPDGIEYVENFDEFNPPPPPPRRRYPSDAPERRRARDVESLRSSTTPHAESLRSSTGTPHGLHDDSATPSLPAPPPDPLPTPPTPAHAPGARAHTHEATADERLARQVMELFEAIPLSSPARRLLPVDEYGVQVAIMRHPGTDVIAAAREVIIRASDAAEQRTHAVRMLSWELERQGTDAPPRTAGTAPPLRALPGGRARDTDPVDEPVDTAAIEARTARAAAGARTWEDQPS